MNGPVSLMSRRKKLGERGGSVVEFALILPLLLLMLCGVGDFGRVLYEAITLSHAANTGAQYGAQSVAKSGDSTGIRQAALDEAQNIGSIDVSSQAICECLDGEPVSCTTTNCPDGYGVPRLFVEVATSTTFRTIVSYPGLPGTVPLSRTVKLRVK